MSNKFQSTTPSYLTSEVIARRTAEREKAERATLRRTHPKTAMAYDIVEALNQPERFNYIWCSIELISMTMNSGASRFRDQVEKDAYRNLKAIFTETDAELPAFRKFMEEVAEWLGY